MDLETAADHGWPLSVVRGDTPMSGRWTWHDRLLAAAFREHKRGLCSGCGSPLAVSTDKTNSKGNPYRTHEYHARKPVVCYSCVAADQFVSDAQEDPHKHLWRIGTERVSVGQPPA